MLHSQQISGTTPFDITWGQATSLLERESLKVMRKKQNRKQDDDSDGIVQLHLAADESDDDDVDERKSTATVEAVGEQESPSVHTEGINGGGEPG